MSAEPLHGPIDGVNPQIVKWLIVGAETGPGAVVPEQSWVDSAVMYFGKIPLFFKDTIQVPITPDREYPVEMQHHV